ncbi:HAD family hydrolase [Rhodomicrobium sp.]|uniref:HAD family hydrolase n=1 Tax=Rhodomicrobium sp. TaxID=2720632 RepID=UPI0039E30DAC
MAAQSTPRLIIFDFDGVIADSEVLACEALAAYAGDLGAPMTWQEAAKLFVGKRASDEVATMEALAGRPLPDFLPELERRTFALFERSLRPIPGVADFIARHADVRRCIASSSSPRRIALCLRVMGLADRFPCGIYSAETVARGKPFPDIFLKAASEEGVEPCDALVIEDSASGVRAALAAGMRVIGLLAASHLPPDHGAALVAAGATFIARDYDEVSSIVDAL